MLTTLIVSIAVALGIALPHVHAAGTPAHAGGAHISAQDGSGGGPPGHP